MESKYIKIKHLGSGKYGIVHLANDVTTGESVALKTIVIKDKYRSEFEKYKREIDILKEVSQCNNIVKIIDYSCTNTKLIIALEYCEEGDLESYIRTHPNIPLDLTRKWIYELLSAVKFLHEKKIIHRDIKPGNILLKNMCIKLGDFGVSRMLSLDNNEKLSICGSPQYMSPERLELKDYSFESDLWSIGIIYYELLTGKCPLIANDWDELKKILRSH